jgi:hypothetical protein
MAKYADEQLKEFFVKSLDGGYDNYTQSKTAIDDNAMVGSSYNVEVDETFTGVKKTGGSTRVSNEVSSGYAVKHVHIHKTTSGDEVIAISGTTVKKIEPSESALTGVAPTADLDYMSFQGGNNSYFFNGSDAPFYYNGSVLTAIASNLPTNGCGMVATYMYRRAFVVDKINKDQLNFSGMFSPEDTRNFLMNFTTGGDNYAGYYTHRPGSGVHITALFDINGVLYFGTDQGEICSVTIASGTGITNAVSVSVQTVVKGTGVSSPFSPVQIGTDMHYFYDKGWFSLGYQQLFGNLLRASVLSKRYKPEFSTILHKDKVAACIFNDTAYISYGSGAYNNRVVKLSFKDRNFQLSAWSAPISGWNVSKWVVYTDTAGVKHLYGGSSLSTDSYVYEYEVGLNNQGAAVDSMVEFKAFDCGLPGQVKYFAFVDIFYSMVYGSLGYEFLIDEITSVTGTRQLGNSNEGGIGVGSQMIGEFMVADELDDTATFASLQQNNRIRIPLNFRKGQTITPRLKNAVLGENFKVNAIKIYFQPGSVYEL